MESQETLIQYRLERARESLEEARILADAGHWHGCVNRLYYACFYAVSALLLKHSLTSVKHTGIRGLFNLHFVKTGKVAAEFGQLYNDLFTYRNKSDYMDLVRFEEDGVRPWISLAVAFVKEITALSSAEFEEATGDDEPDSKVEADTNSGSRSTSEYTTADDLEPAPDDEVEEAGTVGSEEQ